MYTREELIPLLKEAKQVVRTAYDNTKKLNRYKSRNVRLNNLTLRLIVLLMTLGPFLALYYIQTRDVPFLTPFIFNILPGIIPGFEMFYNGLMFAFIALLIYGNIAVSKKDRALNEHPFIKRIHQIIEFPRKKRIAKLTAENNKIKHSKAFSIIPPGYQHANAVDRFYEYLVNGRAHNIREAMEIYELEMHREDLRSIEAAKRGAAISAQQDAKKAVEMIEYNQRYNQRYKR